MTSKAMDPALAAAYETTNGPLAVCFRLATGEELGDARLRDLLRHRVTGVRAVRNLTFVADATAAGARHLASLDYVVSVRPRFAAV